MIIVKIKGGLGNQMFQYAFGKSLSIKNNDELKLDIEGLQSTTTETKRSYTLDKFNIDSKIAEGGEILKLKYPLGILSKIIRFIKAKVFRKFYIGFYKEVLEIKGDAYLDGYYQSPKYFEKIDEIIRHDLSLKNILDGKAGIFKEKIDENDNAVSIHIRRGDYVQDKKINSVHGTCDQEYYNEAIKIIKERIDSPAFFVFSDDIDWVKNNMNFTDSIFVSDPEIKDYEELILMSRCKHNIIANSTFSWWGAWLNANPNKIVIAPKQWNTFDTSDKLGIIPEKWIQL